MSTALLDYTINGRVPQLVGNADPDMAPHGCYAASGDDDWVAIAVRDDADWANLCAAMGMGELTCDDRFADLAARKTNEDELNGIISGWTAGHGAVEIEYMLQAFGVPAHAVSNSSAAAQDPQLQHRGHFVEMEHPEHGTTTFEAAKGQMSETPPSYRSVAPSIGRDNDLVLRDILGYNDEKIAELAIADALT